MRLDDVSVLDFSLTYPGPYCTQLLADAGADVVSVEPESGDPTRSLPGSDPSDGVFTALNRGKRSITLDLNEENDRAAAHRLAATADVVVEGFRPDVARRLGIDYATLIDLNPDLVYCSVTGFGQTGPRRDDPAHDLTVSALGGLLDMTRSEAEGKPTIPGYSIVDATTGALAATSILCALLERELRGDGGTHLDVSMLDALLSLAQSVVPAALAGEHPRPSETPFTGRDPWYDVYETGDGAFVAVGAFEPKFWTAFCAAIDCQELVDAHGTDDPAVRQAIRRTVASRLRERPLDDWLDTFDDVDTPVEPVRSLRDALDSEHVRTRDTIHGREQSLPYVGFPVRVREDPEGDWRRPDSTEPETGARAAAPALDEHRAIRDAEDPWDEDLP